ncbi:MFS general substrate transporter [Hymenopellis radicata]|nr:MFS general substrate transporter [Hymenopellis radicata]
MSGSQDGIEMRPREETAESKEPKQALQEKIIPAVSKEDAKFPKVNDMSFAQVAILLLGLGLSLFLFAIDETIVATSVATIGSELGTKGSLTWITTSYLLTTTVVLPIIGRIADAVDIKTFLIVELWVFVIGNIIAGTAHSLAQLIAGRLLAGVGGAGLLNLTCIIIALMTNEKQRGAYMNLINVVFIFGDSMGPIVGGALAHAGQWRWIFLFTAPFGPVITLFLYVTLRVPPSPARVRSFRQLVTTVDLLGCSFSLHA